MSHVQTTANTLWICGNCNTVFGPGATPPPHTCLVILEEQEPEDDFNKWAEHTRCLNRQWRNSRAFFVLTVVVLAMQIYALGGVIAIEPQWAWVKFVEIACWMLLMNHAYTRMTEYAAQLSPDGGLDG